MLLISHSSRWCHSHIRLVTTVPGWETVSFARWPTRQLVLVRILLGSRHACSLVFNNVECGTMPRFLSRIRQYFEHDNTAEVDLQQTDIQHWTRWLTSVHESRIVASRPHVGFLITPYALTSHNTTTGRNIENEIAMIYSAFENRLRAGLV